VPAYPQIAKGYEPTELHTRSQSDRPANFEYVEAPPPSSYYYSSSSARGIQVGGQATIINLADQATVPHFFCSNCFQNRELES